MKYTIYDPITGAIQSVLIASDESQLNANLAGKSYIEGEYHADEYYIVNGAACALPSNPSSELLPYEFNYATMAWELSPQAAELNRALRNQLLVAVDRVNPIWYNSLTTEQQAELATYRQALLDVPEQTNFPLDINWPAKPAWL